MRMQDFENLWPFAMAVIDSAEHARNAINVDTSNMWLKAFDTCLEVFKQKVEEANNAKV